MNLKTLLLLLLVALRFSSAQAAITDDLAGHWTFDNTSGLTLTDSSDNANDGELRNFPNDDSQWVQGQIGGALNFRGPSARDYVSVPNYPKPTSTMAISVWAWIDKKPADWSFIMSDWVGSCGQFHLALQTGVDISNFTSTDGCAGSPNVREGAGSPFPVGSWQHVVFVADGAMYRLYRNGTEVNSIAYNGTLFQPTLASFSLGARDESNFQWVWKGKLDDLGIWTRSLSPEEIQAIYNAGLAGKDLSTADGTAEKPRIVTQPEGQSRFVGENFSISVRAGGTVPLTYEWTKDGNVLRGKTGATISYTGATADMAGSYKVKVSNALGSVESDPAVITINPVENIRSGLSGHWKLDETTGLVASDSTVPANNGDLLGYLDDNSQWSPGQIAGGVAFGGVDVQNYVQVTDYPKPPNGTATVCAWVWNDVQEGLTFAVTPQFLSSWGNTSARQQFRIGLQNDRLTGVIKTSGGAVVTAAEATPFASKAWQHIALVADGTNLRIYRNGFEAASVTYTRQLASPDGPLNFTFGNLLNDGGSPLGIPNAFYGKLDDVGLWGRALASKEILAIYQAGVANKNLATASVADVTDVAPEISTQPAANTEVFVGQKFSLSVQASGSPPLSYQWKKGNQEIAGATKNTYEVASAKASDSGSYTVVVRNGVGSTPSSPAVVKVAVIDSVAAGLVGHWSFDDTTGLTLTDSTPNANHGVLGKFPDDNSQWVPGKIGGSLAFRGSSSSDHVIVPDYPKPATTMSISIWVWTDVRPSDWTMVVNDWSGSCGQFHVGLFGGVDMANFTSTGKCAASPNTREGSPFPVGSWEHIAFVADGAMMRQYHNGAEVAKVAYDGTIYQPAVKSFGIGMKPNADGSGPGALFWQGKMDDLGIWRRSLSPLEVSAIYEAGLQGKDLTKAVAPTGVGPVFSVQPQSRTVFSGDTVVLSPVISGSQPFTYQWSKNSQPIAGATQATLKLSNLSTAAAGSYTLTVSNAVGNVTSSPAVITVETPADITSGLVGHWPFDNTTGLTLTDATTNANHGTLGNFPADNSQWVAGQIGGSLAFRGPSAQDYVVVPDYPKPFSTMAISIWVNTDVQPSDWAMVVNDWSGSCGQFHVGLFSGVDIANFTADAGCAAILTREGSAFPVGSWQHMAFVADGTMMRLYRNAQQVSAVAYDGTLYQPAVKSFGIGMKPNGDGSGPGAFFWQGKMDDLGIWKRVLSPAEVTAIYNAGLAGKDLTKAATTQGVSLTVVQSGGSITISWPATATGFVLESNTTLGPGTAWTPVPGVTGNSFTVTGKTGNTFYRLKK
jgi:hypothetical protein